MSLSTTAQIIEKWYLRLGFDKRYDAEFYAALKEIEIPDGVRVEDYDVSSQDGKKNLLAFLYFCERTSEEYKKRGISEEILIDTLFDIVRWCDIWSNIKGELFLGELDWLSIHLQLKLFKLGRLQYCMQKFRHNVAAYGINEGDDSIGVHIPSDGPLDTEECKKSLTRVRPFFDQFFPDYHYDYIFCESWLLDDTLKQIMKPGSNIVAFGDLFTKVHKYQADALLGYVFEWGTTREQLAECEPKSSFAARVKDWILSGNNFYETLGIIKK